MNSGGLAEEELRDARGLSVDEERNLLAKTKTGDFRARGQIVLALTGLVKRIAIRYGRFGLPVEDLVHEGYLGLVHAIGRFEPRGTARLSTYAVWWIRHYMWKAIAEQGGPICLPAPLPRRLHALRRVTERLTEQLQREPSPGEIAADMGCSATKVQTLLRVGGRPTPSRGTFPVETSVEFLPDNGQPTPLEHLTTRSLHHALHRGLRKITKREADVLRQYYGLAGTPPRTFDAIGRSLSLSGERVRQLERSALKKLRDLL